MQAYYFGKHKTNLKRGKITKIPKISFEEALESIVLAEKCTGCAACTVVCPLNCLEYTEGKPKLIKECSACGICAVVCPRYDFSLYSLEKFMFGRERKPEENFGIYRRIVIAQASDKKILQVCQDGGVVTALLTFALRKGIIDGAAVSGASEDKPFFPVPRLVMTPREVLECGGTRYSYSPNLLAFKEGIEEKRKSLALVGTPCQVQAIRKIQMVPLKKYVNPLKLTIGLMCTECFTYKGLMEKELFENALEKGILRTKPLEQEKKAVDLLVKLSRKKRKISYAYTQT